MAESSVSQIVSTQRGLDFEERHKLLHSLDAAFFGQSADTLLDFLARNAKPEGMHIYDYLSLKNDVFDLLVSQDPESAEALLRLAISVIEDASSDEVWKDYCVQKMAIVLPEIDAANKNCIRAYGLLRELAAGHHPGLQGTALIVSVELMDRAASAESSWISPEKLCSYAYDSLSSERAELLDRITALQVLSKLGDTRALLFSRKYLTTYSTDHEPMLAVSSISAIGQLGEPSDVSLLSGFRQSADIRFRTAARVAIQKLSQES